MATKFIVNGLPGGETFDTPTAAHAALKEARLLLPYRVFKKASIEPVPDSSKPWMVTVPHTRFGGVFVPLQERVEQLERFKSMAGDYAAYFDTEEAAEDVIFNWSMALGFSVAVLPAVRT